MQRTKYSVLAFALLSLMGSRRVSAESPDAGWFNFQNAGGLSVDAGSIASKWSPEENIAWVAAIDGYGQSTPVIEGGQIYVTSVSGDQRDQYHLAVFELTSGKKLWQNDFENPAPEKNTAMTSRAAPTPVVDTNGCIAFFEGGIVVAVDHDGVIRWQRNLVSDYGKADARHGLSASLEFDDKRVYVWVERSEDPYLLALDKETGKTIWKTRGVGSTSWASPRLIPVDDGVHLVCSASGKIIGVEPESGTRLWEFTDIANNTSCTPVPVSTGRFLIGASDGRGEESVGTGAASNGVVEVKRREGDGYAVSFLWNAEKASSSFGSPIVAAGTACVVNRAGVLYRLNAETGKRVSTLRTSAGGIWATPIASGDLLYLFGSNGTTSVISLSSSKEVASNRLWRTAGSESERSGGVLYAAAAVPPYLIMRRGDSLYAVKQSD
jgi:outer membrane protein assembly factor BamB